jgi:hypothetical protein
MVSLDNLTYNVTCSVRLVSLLAVVVLLVSCKPEKLAGSPPGLDVYPDWVELTPASELHRGGPGAKPLRYECLNGVYPKHWPSEMTLEDLGTVFVANFSDHGSAETTDRNSQFTFISEQPVEALIKELKRLLESNGYELNFKGTTWGADRGTPDLRMTSVTGYRHSSKSAEAVLFLIFKDPTLGKYTWVRARYSEIPGW